MRINLFAFSFGHADPHKRNEESALTPPSIEFGHRSWHHLLSAAAVLWPRGKTIAHFNYSICHLMSVSYLRPTDPTLTCIQLQHPHVFVSFPLPSSILLLPSTSTACCLNKNLLKVQCQEGRTFRVPIKEPQTTAGDKNTRITSSPPPLTCCTAATKRRDNFPKRLPHTHSILLSLGMDTGSRKDSGGELMKSHL